MFVIRIRERFKRSTNAIASNKTTPSIIHTPKIIFRIFFNVIPSIVVRTIKNSVLSNMYPQHIQYSRNPSHRPVHPPNRFASMWVHSTIFLIKLYHGKDIVTNQNMFEVPSADGDTVTVNDNGIHMNDRMSRNPFVNFLFWRIRKGDKISTKCPECAMIISYAFKALPDGRAERTMTMQEQKISKV